MMLKPIKIWLVVDLPLWKIMEFVSWDDEIPNIYMESHKIHVPNHQPVTIGFMVAVNSSLDGTVHQQTFQWGSPWW